MQGHSCLPGHRTEWPCRQQPPSQRAGGPRQARRTMPACGCGPLRKDSIEVAGRPGLLHCPLPPHPPPHSAQQRCWRSVFALTASRGLEGGTTPGSQRPRCFRCPGKKGFLSARTRPLGKFGRMAVTWTGRFLSHPWDHSTSWGAAQLLGKPGPRARAGPYSAQLACPRATLRAARHVPSCGGHSGRPLRWPPAAAGGGRLSKFCGSGDRGCGVIQRSCF